MSNSVELKGLSIEPVYSRNIEIGSNSKFTSMETVTNIRDMVTE